MTVSKSTRIISVNTCSNAMRIAMILGYYTFILHWIDIGTFDRRCQFTDQAFIKHVVALVAKNPPASAGDKREVGLIPGSGRFPGGGHGNPLQYSCLEKSTDRGAWRTAVHRVSKSWTQLKWLNTHIWYIRTVLGVKVVENFWMWNTSRGIMVRTKRNRVTEEGLIGGQEFLYTSYRYDCRRVKQWTH